MPLKTNGQALRSRRELRGLTATEFARQAGYTLTHVSQVELGKSNAGPRYLRKAARILDCQIADITEPPASTAPLEGRPSRTSEPVDA